jgi:hypothetical protein
VELIAPDELPVVLVVPAGIVPWQLDPQATFCGTEQSQALTVIPGMVEGEGFLAF